VFYTHNFISELAIIDCPEIKMRNILKNRTALSTVVTTLIILVVSVLLAGVVTYFAINVTSTRVQEENLHLTKQHIWHNMTSAQGAVMIINTGGRDVVLDKITVRGQESTWTDIFYNITQGAFSNDLSFSSLIFDTANDNETLTIGASDYIFMQATNDLVLPSGKTMLLYVNSPDSISVNDVGLTVAITIFSSQAMYYKETNVQAV
jgi:heme/copper-type cytochrome/quinol oxidase subunit 2